MREQVAHVDIEPAQVFAEVKFVATLDNNNLEHGIEFTENDANTGFRWQIQDQGPFPANRTVLNNGVAENVGEFPFQIGEGTSVFNEAFRLPSILDLGQLNMAINLIDRDNRSRVIQSPALFMLDNQDAVIFVGDQVEPVKFTKQIAFNVIPHIDVFMDDGSTKEEWKMMVETKKILDPKIKLNATCVRVPVFVGHSEAVNIEFENELSAEQAQEILREAPGIMLIDKREDEGYVTPVESAGDSATYVSRVRDDPTVDNGITLWCVSDNLRKGAALNAVQIAELLGRECLKKG